MVKRIGWLWAACIVLAVSAAQAAAAKESPAETDKVLPPAAASGSPSPHSTAEGLSTTQQQLAAEFKDLQGILMRTRDQVRQTDPDRAALIEKVLKESGQRGVEGDFQDIVDLLRRDKFGDAVRKQGKVNEDLDAILKLLLNEDRSRRIQDEKALIRKYLNQLGGIIRDQKDVQGRVAGGENPQSLSGEQGSLAQRTGGLSNDIRENRERGRNEGDKNDKGNKNNKSDKGDGKSDGKSRSGGEGKSPAKSPGKEPKSSAKDPSKSSGKGGEQSKDPSAKGEGKPNPGEGGKPSEGAKSQGKGQPGQGQGQGQAQEQGEDQNDSPQQAQNSGNPPQEQDPVRKRLEAAKGHMEKAKERLEKAKKDGALDEQELALRELDTAKAELEEILRQLREEEMKRLLAMLEARFQKVLQIQRKIYDDTVRLDKIPAVERSHGFEIDTGRLSNGEAEIVMEVAKALSLLREDGTSVAMPEAVQQVHDDMQQLVHRLAEGKTEVLTQAIETDVIKGLEEIIDALKKAQKDADGKKKPPGPSPNGQPQDPPLIEQLAELKMIRALQMRVNSRTDRYSKLIDGEQAAKEDVLDALRHLSEQEARVHKVTRDLELGKNE